MKIIRTLYFIVGMSILLATVGCNSAIYDDLTECPQGINFKFYRQTPCESHPTYPSDLKQLKIFVFDGDGVLVEEFTDEDVSLSADYKLSVLLPHMENFTFVAWGGERLEDYRFSSFEKRKTKKEDMLLYLIHEKGKIIKKPSSLYWGTCKAPANAKKNTNSGSVYESLAFNMEEMTNRVKLTVRGLSESNTYAVFITDDNDRYDFTGAFSPDTQFDYIPVLQKENTVLHSTFTLMKIAEKRDIRLSIINTTTGKTIYTADLVDDLIMYREHSGEPPYSLACTHDFEITLTIENHALVRAVVNDWNIISRPVELDS